MPPKKLPPPKEGELLSSFFKSAGTFKQTGPLTPSVSVEDLTNAVIARNRAKALDKACEILGISMVNATCGAVSKALRIMRNAALTTAERFSSLPLSEMPAEDSEFNALVRKILTEVVLTSESGDVEWAFLKTADDEEAHAAPTSAATDSEDASGFDDAEADDACCKKYGFAHPAFSVLARSWLHMYDTHGRHCGWVPTDMWREKVERDLGFKMSRATSYRWARAEKTLYASGGTDAKGRKAVSNRNDASFMKLMADLESSKKLHEELKVEPVELVELVCEVKPNF